MEQLKLKGKIFVTLQKKNLMTFLVLMGFAVLIMVFVFLLFGVRILFHKSHKFPETSAGHNREMRKMGITCPRHEEIKCWSDKNKQPSCATCYEHARD
jgi:hypothetical protein